MVLRQAAFSSRGMGLWKEILLFIKRIAGPGSPKSHTAKTCGMSVSEGCKDRLTKGGMLQKNNKKK